MNDEKVESLLVRRKDVKEQLEEFKKVLLLKQTALEEKANNMPIEQIETRGYLKSYNEIEKKINTYKWVSFIFLLLIGEIPPAIYNFLGVSLLKYYLCKGKDLKKNKLNFSSYDLADIKFELEFVSETLDKITKLESLTTSNGLIDMEKFFIGFDNVCSYIDSIMDYKIADEDSKEIPSGIKSKIKSFLSEF